MVFLCNRRGVFYNVRMEDVLCVMNSLHESRPVLQHVRDCES
jgi:hypothetical protein